MKKSSLLVFFTLFTIFSVVEAQGPLTILVAVPRFPVISQTFILHQITGLIDQGHTVMLWAKKASGQRLAPQYDRYDLPSRVYIDELPKNLDDIDVILCQLGNIGTLFADFKKRLGFRAKLITCFRGRDLSACIKYEHSKKRYAELFAVGDLFLPVCDLFRHTLIELGCPAEKIIVHHSGIDTEFYNLKKRSFMEDDVLRLISVNRLIAKKGTSYALRALAHFRQQYPQVKVQYAIVGSGPGRAGLEQLAKKLHIRECVTFYGLQQNAVVHEMLGNSDIFLLPSRTSVDNDQEGIPNALKEAMARALPVITTYHSGIPELVVDTVSGFLVQEKKIEPILARLIDIYTQQEKAVCIGACAREHVLREHDAHTLNQRLEQLLLNLCAS